MSGFVLIGERLNTHRESFQKLIDAHDVKGVKKEAVRQQRNGATHLDFNTGANKEKETDEMLWLLDTALPSLKDETGVVIDTASTDCLRRALKKIGKRAGTIVNAIGNDAARSAEFLSLAVEHNAGVIAVLGGAQQNSMERLNSAGRLHREIQTAGVSEDQIYFDPQVLPLASNAAQPTSVLESIREIRRHWPGTHVLAGLSNISFNLPRRSLLNRAYLVMLLASGVDSLICDPCDKELRATLLAARALLGQDEFLTTYLSEVKAKD